MHTVTKDHRLRILAHPVRWLYLHVHLLILTSAFVTVVEGSTISDAIAG